jgi:hypothetical protein
MLKVVSPTENKTTKNKQKEEEKRSTDCNICCEKFNKNTNKRITCLHCNEDVCMGCCQTYFLGTMEEAQCMCCKKEWNIEFLSNNFPKQFVWGPSRKDDVKSYREHREDVLLDKQMTLMPATQPFVTAKVNIIRFKKKRDKYRQKMYDFEQKIFKAERDYRNFQNKTKDETVSDSFVNRGHCPKTDCNGFIIEKWVCGVCDVKVCSKCMEPKESAATTAGSCKAKDHVCKEDSVRNVKFIREDTKPCPGCRVRVHRVAGCFAKDTKVLMYDGSLKMSQNIGIGDTLIGDDGNKRTVKELFTGTDKLYEVVQNNGENYTVNSKHTLVLKYVGEKSINWVESINSWNIRWFCRDKKVARSKNFNVTDDITKEDSKLLAEEFIRDHLNFDDNVELTIDDYIKLNDSTKKHLVGFKSSNGVNYEEKDVKFDPYLLGVWLGDGTHTHPIIASNDIEIQKYVLNWCHENDAELRRKNNSNGKVDLKNSIGNSSCESCKACDQKGQKICDTTKDDVSENANNLRTNPFTNQLKHYKLIGNKHIPKDYMMNSRDIRLKVLAGIIDSDGNVSNEGKRIQIIQTEPKLSDQIILLARSLGFVVNFRMRERKNVSIFNGPKKDYKDQCTINLSGNISEIPTILPRKVCVNSNPNKDYHKTSINIKYVKEDKYFGFNVGENHLFVGSDLTVLKNCYQMFCTNCHVFFDWTKNTILKKTRFVHNPHYDEWVQKNGTGDAPSTFNAQFTGICGVTNSNLYGLPVDKKSKDELVKILRLVNQIRDETQRVPEIDRKLHGYRMDFLENIITKDELKVKVQRIFKASMKLRDTNQIRDMYSDTTYQLMGNLIDDVKRVRLALDPLIVGTLDRVKKKTAGLNSRSKDYAAKRVKIIVTEKGSLSPELMDLYEKSLKDDQKLVDDCLQKLKELKDYAEKHLVNVGFRYNSGTPHLSDWEFRDTKYQEKTEKIRLNKRKELGTNACANENCAYRKSGQTAHKGKCSQCYYSDERALRENRRRELQNQGLPYTEIQRRLITEGFST